MSESPPVASPRKKPVDVQARIQHYQKPTDEKSPNQLVKSNSYSDLQTLITKVDVRNSWLQISVIEKHSFSSSPPKPPARRKKFQPLELPKHPYIKSPESTVPDVSQQTKLSSTELSILPSQQRPPLRKAQTLRPTPPRPPPPSLKPVVKAETIKPAVISTEKKTPTEDKVSLSPVPSPKAQKPVLPTSPKPERHTKIKPTLEIQKTMTTRPLPSVPSDSPSSIRKNSGNSSSLSDSNEEEKKGNEQLLQEWLLFN